MASFCCIGRDGFSTSLTCLLCTEGDGDLTVATGFCFTITEVRSARLTNFGRVKGNGGASCWIWSVIDPKGGSVGIRVTMGGGLLCWLFSGPDPKGGSVENRVKMGGGLSCWLFSGLDPKGGSVGTRVKVDGGLSYWLCSGSDPLFPSQLVRKREEVGSSSNEGDIYELGSTLCFKVRSSFSFCLPILRKISRTLFADPELPPWCPCCRSLYALANLRLFCSALGRSPRPCWGGEL